MIKFLQFIVFLILQILFIPRAIIVFILAVYKEMRGSKKLGVSFTAGQTIQGRWDLYVTDLVRREKFVPSTFELGFPM